MTDIMQEYSQFTQQAYASLLITAKKRWNFVSYNERCTEQPSVLWRHDVDFSPQRALALASIEANEGVIATYFVLLHGEFYNPLEASVTDIFKQIACMGHRIGLHFDPAYYGATLTAQHGLIEKLALEKQILEQLLETRIEAFSWHNPTVTNALDIADSQLAGMINTYCREIRDKFTYISDSNGLWRHRSLQDVIASPDITHLQVLTHPEWWTPEPMAPRDRILRAINGRAAACMRNYDQLLETHGRPNIHGPAQGTQC